MIHRQTPRLSRLGPEEQGRGTGKPSLPRTVGEKKSFPFKICMSYKVVNSEYRFSMNSNHYREEGNPVRYNVQRSDIKYGGTSTMLSLLRHTREGTRTSRR